MFGCLVWARTWSAMACGMSCRGRTRWTSPVSIAAPGMPKCSALSLFWANTVPWQWLMARMPACASVPLPVSTTARARGPQVTARVASSRSAGGRAGGEVSGLDQSEAGCGGHRQVLCGWGDHHGADGEDVAVAGGADGQRGAETQDFDQGAGLVRAVVLDDEHGRG